MSLDMSQAVRPIRLRDRQQKVRGLTRRIKAAMDRLAALETCSRTPGVLRSTTMVRRSALQDMETLSITLMRPIKEVR